MSIAIELQCKNSCPVQFLSDPVLGLGGLGPDLAEFDASQLVLQLYHTRTTNHMTVVAAVYRSQHNAPAKHPCVCQHYNIGIVAACIWLIVDPIAKTTS